MFNVIWNFFPVNPSQMVAFVLDWFGVDYGQNLLNFIWVISPLGAYLNGMQLVVLAEFFQRNTGMALGEQPFYLEGWFMLVLLAVWVVVPLALGYWHFRRADIGQAGIPIVASGSQLGPVRSTRSVSGHPTR